MNEACVARGTWCGFGVASCRLFAFHAERYIREFLVISLRNLRAPPESSSAAKLREHAPPRFGLAVMLLGPTLKDSTCCGSYTTMYVPPFEWVSILLPRAAHIPIPWLFGSQDSTTGSRFDLLVLIPTYHSLLFSLTTTGCDTAAIHSD